MPKSRFLAMFHRTNMKEGDFGRMLLRAALLRGCNMQELSWLRLDLGERIRVARYGR